MSNYNTFNLPTPASRIIRSIGSGVFIPAHNQSYTGRIHKPDSSEIKHQQFRFYCLRLAVDTVAKRGGCVMINFSA